MVKFYKIRIVVAYQSRGRSAQFLQNIQEQDANNIDFYLSYRCIENFFQIGKIALVQAKNIRALFLNDGLDSGVKNRADFCYNKKAIVPEKPSCIM